MKKNLCRILDLIAIALIAFAACVALAGCFAIPVRAVPTDEPILVAPVGTQTTQEDGAVWLNANLPQPDASKFPPAASTTAGWGQLLNVLMTVLGATGAGGFLAVLPRLGKLKTALTIAAELADRNAAANTDEEVAVNKSLALAKQKEAGVVALTQKARGK